MPRVLLTGFCAVPGPRRAGVQLRHVIRALTPMHSVDLLVVREGEQGYVERQGSVRVLRVPTQEADQKSQIQAFQRALRRQLDGADYEVVHCRDSWSCMPVLEARERFDFAVVYDLTRSPLGETTGDTELDAQYARDEETCLRAADMILAPTPAAVKALEGRGRPSRVVLSPPGVDVDRFDWDDPPGEGPPRILYVGTLDPGRGIRVLVRAMAAIVREVDARLVLAGAMLPKFEQTLRDGIRELGLTSKVEIMGPVDHDQLPALYASATVCVVPSAADLSPNPTVIYPTKLLEYMACRRAIVAPRRDTIAQVVENNHEALLFDPGDPIDLARKVLRVLGEPMLRDRLAANAYERVRRDLTASAARRAIRKAYDVLSVRFAGQFADDADDAPKPVEMLSDDDFEATVFEEAPAPPGASSAKRGINITGASQGSEIVDTAISAVRIEHALASLEEDANSAEAVVAPPPPLGEPDETMERVPVAPADTRDTGAWTAAIARPPPSEKLANKLGRSTSG
nr:glycosyltransferase [Deltaproteobacteria bacterium]